MSFSSHVFPHKHEYEPPSDISKQSLLLSDRDTQVTDSPQTISNSLISSPRLVQPPGYVLCVEAVPLDLSSLSRRYLETRRPNTQITYTFYPQTIPANSMILKPPDYVKNPHTSYYISVNMNCFTPSSYITTIRKDGWEGDVIGDFEYDFIAINGLH